MNFPDFESALGEGEYFFLGQITIKIIGVVKKISPGNRLKEDYDAIIFRCIPGGRKLLFV